MPEFVGQVCRLLQLSCRPVTLTVVLEPAHAADHSAVVALLRQAGFRGPT